MRRALLVGVDSYVYLPDMHGRRNAADSLGALIGNQIGPDDQCTEVITPTGDEGELSALTLEDALDAALENCDELWFYFAGHGVARDNDLWLLTSDHDPFSREPRGQSLRQLMERVATSLASQRCTILLDCPDADTVQTIPVPSGQMVMTVANLAGGDNRWPSTPGLDFSDALLRGARFEAADAVGRVTALSLFAYVSGVLSDAKRWQPILAGRIVGTRVLRWANSISSDDARKLVEVFRSKDARAVVTPDHEWPGIAPVRPGYQLVDPAFEFRSRPRDWSEHNLEAYLESGLIDERQMELQLQMGYFQRLRNAGLLRVVEPDTALFWACMHNGSVELTELGQRYWELASRGEI